MPEIVFENPTTMLFGPVGAPISDMVELEGVGDMTFSLELVAPTRRVAQPTERWCRFCGGGVEQDAIWRMSCDPCWEENHPTAFSIAQLYGEIRLDKKDVVLGIVSTTA